MSKAFTKEDVIEEPLNLNFRNLTPGIENHMTKAGFEALQSELRDLSHEAMEPAQELRAAHIRQALESAHVIDVSEQRGERVLFGATVHVKDEEEAERIYQIVGVDEADAKSGRISWISPIAKALLQAKVGDVVLLKTPVKEEELEILKIEFK